VFFFFGDGSPPTGAATDLSFTASAMETPGFSRVFLRICGSKLSKAPKKFALSTICWNILRKKFF